MILSNVCIVTKDVRKLTDFYKSLFEFDPVYENDFYVEFAVGGTKLCIYDYECHEKMAPNSVIAADNHSVLLEFEVDDLEKRYEMLKEKKVEFIKDMTIQPWGTRSFYFRDPDGNIIDFFRKIKK